MKIQSGEEFSNRIIYIPLALILTVILIGFGLLDLYFGKTLTRRYENDLIRLATSGAQMIGYVDKDAGPLAWDQLADSFAEEGKFRTTLIDISGQVQGDSRLSLQEIQQIGNHADRPEILQARDSGTGLAIRRSKTLHMDLLYVATRYHHDQQSGYFRISIPLDELKKERMNQRVLFGTFCLVLSIVSGMLSLTVSRYIISLVRKGKDNLEKRVDEKTKQIKTLQHIGTQLTACNSLSEALEIISIGTSVLLPGHAGAIALFRASKDKLEVLGTWNGEWQGEKLYSPDQCWGLRSGQPHLGDVTSGHIRCGHSPEGLNSMLCIPVVSQGRTHGVFHFYSKEGRDWSPEEHQLACAVAEHASLTIASLDLKESLRQQAIRDPLTGLYNRRYLMETLETEMARAVRHHKMLAVLMMDLDHFKKFNDDHGHDTGDFILNEFGRLVRKLIRREDIACRYGGEEFTILLPEADIKQAWTVAEKIRTLVRGHDFLYKNQFYGPITISIGGAVYPQHAETVETLFKTADKALYLAKQSGRDKVLIASGTSDVPLASGD